MRSPFEIDDFVGFHLFYTHLTFFDMADIIPGLFRDVEILEVSHNEIRYRITTKFYSIIIKIDNNNDV